jgi:hypothetical protein
MDSLKGNTADSVHFKKIEGRWVPVTVNANGSIETNRSIQSISSSSVTYFLAEELRIALTISIMASF